jgi:outer membrane protein OmpA-like peptidoglycan-associated protein
MKSPLLTVFLFVALLSTPNAQSSFPLSVRVPAPDGYLLENATDLNSPYLDFCAVPYRNSVVFTSSRGDGRLLLCENDLTAGRYTDLYVAKIIGPGRFGRPEPVYGALHGKYHDGTATFSRDGEIVCFSRNHASRGNQADLDLRIYRASRSKGDWVEPEELPINIEGYITSHPALSADGQSMVFASNRPGGYGGMDLYMVKKNGAEWGLPVNMGPNINTTGQEVFPFLAEAGMLYFSSDGYSGLGGLDVFAVRMRESRLFQFLHLPPPVNTPHDDFGFMAEPGGKQGYLSSDRPGGLGQDDIYRWRYVGILPTAASISVVDGDTGERMKDANLTVTAADGGPDTWTAPGSWGGGVPVSTFGRSPRAASAADLPFPWSTDMQLLVLPGHYYRVKVEKPGYQTVERFLSGAELTAEPEYLIPLHKGILRTVRHQVFRQDTERGLSDCTVTIRNECTGYVSTLKTGDDGSFDFPFDCRCAYDILVTREGFTAKEKRWAADGPDCQTDVTAPSRVYLSRESVDRILEAGDVVNLHFLYYDYDQVKVRPEDVPALDRLVRIMEQDPSMEIEIRSYTDSRGTVGYNLGLSQKRAEAVRHYLVGKGIARDRIEAYGFGESKLLNDCRDHVPCPEAMHQINRRTEFKVLRLTEPNVRF